MKFKSYIYTLIVSVTALFFACTPDKYDLGTMDFTTDDLVEGLAYTITHDKDNPNIVYLTSLLDSKYTVLWEHPQGRTQEQTVTLKMPFAGTYSVTFGVETRGGIVYGEPVTFTIEEFYAEFVSDELWTLLSGGVDQSKTWYLDLDAEGASRFFAGPIYFFTSNYVWDNLHSASNDNYIDADAWDPKNAIVPNLTEGGDAVWYWLADWAGNSWMVDAADFGTMTFDLKGGANVVVDQEEYGLGYKKGVYMIDTDAHTIQFTDVRLLHDSNRDGDDMNWTNVRILYISENALQLGVPPNDLNDPDASMVVYNYISEDYYNNWSPTVDNNAVPELPDDWRDYVEPKTNKVITYKLSADTPFDWCNLDGSLKGISTVSAVSGVEDITLVINSGTGEYTFTDLNGNDYIGKYTLSSDGIYTFEALPEVVLSTDGRAVLRTNADGTLRIMQYETSDYTGAVTELWLGSQERDDQGNLYQYMGYRFVVQSAGAVTNYRATLNFYDTDWSELKSDPLFISIDGNYTFTIEGASNSLYILYLDIEKILKDNPDMDVAITDIKVDGTSISFDDTAIERGIGDVETTARRYIVNPWGATAGDASNYVFSSGIAVTVNIKLDNGTPFITE